MCQIHDDPFWGPYSKNALASGEYSIVFIFRTKVLSTYTHLLLCSCRAQICILSFSSSIVCRCRLSFLFIHIYFSGLLALVFSYSVRNIRWDFVPCRVATCPTNHIERQMEKRTKKEYESWLFVNKKRSAMQKMEHLCWISVQCSPGHQFYSTQTRLFHSIIHTNLCARTNKLCTALFQRCEEGVPNERLINEERRREHDVDSSITYPKHSN